MAEPIVFPEWDTNKTNVIEPAQTYKDDGWSLIEKPPSQYFNWWQNNVYEWIVWLEERFDANNVYKLLTNVTGAAPGTANIGSGYQGTQNYGQGAIGNQYYADGAAGNAFFGNAMTGFQFYGRQASGPQYYGLDSTDIIEIGSTAGSDATKKIISGTVSATFKEVIDGSKQASTTAIGSVELATDAEAIAGTDTLRAVTPANLDAVVGDGDWQTPTFLNGWASDATEFFRYKLIEGGKRLVLHGELDGSSNTAATVLTLPSGYIPNGDRRSAIRIVGTGAEPYCAIQGSSFIVNTDAGPSGITKAYVYVTYEMVGPTS